MQWNKYNRNAVPGELVNYYGAGRKDVPPVVGMVTASSGQVAEISLFRPGHARHHCLSSVRHINDPHWLKYPELLVKEGAWDFHPIHGEPVQAEILKEEARKARLAPKPKEEMSAEEVEALDALDRLGPFIGKISADLGIKPEMLKTLPKFMAEFSAQKASQSTAKAKA